MTSTSTASGSIDPSTTTVIADVPLDDDTGIWNIDDRMTSSVMLAFGIAGDSTTE